MNLGDLVFPVYVVGKEEPLVDDGVAFYAYVKTSVEGDDTDHVKVLDDKNLPQPSLATRRLILRDRGVPLHKLSKAIFFLGDLIKIADAKTWFIDSNGKVFNYRKTKRVPLLFKKIANITPLKGGGAIIEVEGIGTRFKTLLAPTRQEKYAGLLKVGIAYILYGLYKEDQPQSYRNI